MRRNNGGASTPLETLGQRARNEDVQRDKRCSVLVQGPPNTADQLRSATQRRRLILVDFLSRFVCCIRLFGSLFARLCALVARRTVRSASLTA